VPSEALALLPGDAIVGQALVAHPGISGVQFTGSTFVAREIAKVLAARPHPSPLIPLIAETGGMNAMIVDSSALCEQVVHDVVLSAFYSAGQRCSALRVLYVQEEVSERLITMLKGAMAELEVGDPGCLSFDIGPVIDRAAKQRLETHVDQLKSEGAELLRMVDLKAHTDCGTFFAPRMYRIRSMEQLKTEVFGPILHIIVYPSKGLDGVLADIGSSGYGLTLGIHSRIDDTVQYIIDRVHVGNIYVNRNMIGAVVGVQPFGGEGLSGTGPKAGGPHMLTRLATERTISINTVAAGGNASLMNLKEG
jgi:RHH-type proline utilization regulon transcriptional repressor/proline dehydrogenase/delta 1-pyrroline-5-carboxylate dehydrogenase